MSSVSCTEADDLHSHLYARTPFSPPTVGSELRRCQDHWIWRCFGTAIGRPTLRRRNPVEVCDVCCLKYSSSPPSSSVHHYNRGILQTGLLRCRQGRRTHPDMSNDCNVRRTLLDQISCQKVEDAVDDTRHLQVQPWRRLSRSQRSTACGRGWRANQLRSCA